MIAGPRVIGEESKKAMKQLLKEIQDGTFGATGYLRTGQDAPA